MDRRSFLAKLAGVPVLVAAGAALPADASAAAERRWTTATGALIPYGQLTDDHLLNIERMLRGDGAQTYRRANRESEHRAIVAEVARRGLVTLPALEREDLSFTDWEAWSPQDDRSLGSW